MSPRKCCKRERRHYVTFGGRNGCAHVNSVGFWRVIALLSQTNSIAAARPPHDQIHVSLWFRASSFSCWGPRHGRRSTRSAGAGSSKRPCNARAMVRWPTLQRWQCNNSMRDTRSINSAAGSTALASTTGIPSPAGLAPIAFIKWRGQQPVMANALDARRQHIQDGHGAQAAS